MSTEAETKDVDMADATTTETVEEVSAKHSRYRRCYCCYVYFWNDAWTTMQYNSLRLREQGMHHPLLLVVLSVLHFLCFVVPFGSAPPTPESLDFVYSC
jgi:hypothetical protein